MAALDKGIRILVLAGTGYLFSQNIIRNTIPTKVVTPYKKAPVVVKPGQRHLDLLDEVCTKMHIDADQIHLYYSKGLHAEASGCLYSPWKSALGLPRNFSFTRPEHIQEAGMTLKGEAENWDSESRKALLETLTETLIASNEEVKFRMAHELTHINDKHFLVDSLHDTLFCFAGYKAGTHLASLNKIYTHLPPVRGIPTAVKLSIHLLVWAVTFVVFRESRQKLDHWSEFKADACAAQLGDDYANGGVDFFNGQLKLARLMRDIMGSSGKKMYSEEGNVNNLETFSLFKLSHPNFTDRLKRIEEIKAFS